MKKLIIVQARMSSSRLPGKVLKKVCDKPLLEHLINRLKRVNCADQIVIATTVNEPDNQIIDLCEELGVFYYRGSEEDVLERYYETAVKYKGDVLIRVTSDCPVIDPDIVNDMIVFFIKNIKKYDYASNTLKRTYPQGMDTEIFSLDTLKEANIKASEPYDREHVTPYIKMRPQQFRLYNMLYKEDMSRYRWTVDTSADLELISNIYEGLYYKNPYFSLVDILDLMKRNPEWETMNTNVEKGNTNSERTY